MNFNIILIIILSINVIAQISCTVSLYKNGKELDKLIERVEHERKENQNGF